MYVEQYKSSKFSSSHFTGESPDVTPPFLGTLQFVSNSIPLHDIIHLRFMVQKNIVLEEKQRKKKEKRKNKENLYPIYGINEHDQYRGTD